MEQYKLGEYVFKIGDVGTKFYVIMEGYADVLLPKKLDMKDAAALNVVKTFKAGDFFGELALLKDQARSASI